MKTPERLHLMSFCCLPCWLWLHSTQSSAHYPTGIYLFKVNNRNSRSMCEIWSKLIIKTLEQSHWRRSGVFIICFERISFIVTLFPCWLWTMKYWLAILLFLLQTLNMYLPAVLIWLKRVRVLPVVSLTRSQSTFYDFKVFRYVTMRSINLTVNLDNQLITSW